MRDSGPVERALTGGFESDAVGRNSPAPEPKRVTALRDLSHDASVVGVAPGARDVGDRRTVRHAGIGTSDRLLQVKTFDLK
jgi:hypothetical protein